MIFQVYEILVAYSKLHTHACICTYKTLAVCVLYGLTEWIRTADTRHDESSISEEINFWDAVRLRRAMQIIHCMHASSSHLHLLARTTSTTMYVVKWKSERY